MSRILQKDNAARWAEMGDHEKYVPIRDGKRQHKSRWVIDTLSNRLPPEHVSLARQLLRQQAIAEGRKPQDYDRVDRGGNSAESSLIGRLDAQRALTGFERAVYRTLALGGVYCFRAIVEGDTLAETMRRCGYHTSADRRTCELVQLTMLQASDYDELCRAEALRWGDTAVSQCA